MTKLLLDFEPTMDVSFRGKDKEEGWRFHD
jgi:hypothetical protein